MRVCCCCESWESGGIESFLTNALLRMDRTGLEVDIVAAELRESVFTEQLREAGVRFYELSGSLNRIARNSRLLQGIFEERKYNVFHLHAYQALSFRYLKQAKQSGIPVRIAHSHNTALRKSRGRRLKLGIHCISRALLTGYATDLWACSRQAAEFLFSPRELKGKGYRFIPNGIEMERFRFNSEAREQIRKELHCESKLVIGNVGRLCYQKNQAFLLEAFAEVHGKQPDSVLLLVGEGEDRPMLEEQAERLGIRERVLFYGISGAAVLGDGCFCVSEPVRGAGDRGCRSAGSGASGHLFGGGAGGSALYPPSGTDPAGIRPVGPGHPETEGGRGPLTLER